MLVYVLSSVFVNPLSLGLFDLLLFRGDGFASFLALPLWFILAGGSILIARGARERTLGALLTLSVLLWSATLLVSHDSFGSAVGLGTVAQVASSACAPVVLYEFSTDLVRDRNEAEGFRRLGLTFGLGVAALSAMWWLVLYLPDLGASMGLTALASPIWRVVPFIMFMAAIASAVAFLQLLRDASAASTVGARIVR